MEADRIKEKAGISDGNLKRQIDDGGGEEVDLNGIPDDGQTIPSNPQQPFGPQPAQPPFFGGGPYFPQQPFYNGFGYPGNPQGFQPQNFQPQGYPPQGYPQFNFPGRSVILQNNGKQYLVQPLGTNQKIVQKNGKQYLLQPITTNTNAALTNANGLSLFNVRSASLTGLPGGVFGPTIAGLSPNSALTAAQNGNPLFSANAPQSANAPGNAAIRPNFLPGSEKVASLSSPQRLILSNGKGFEVEQIPVQGGNSPYLTAAVGAVAGQLAAQAGRQYPPFALQQYAPFPPNNPGLSSAYARANQAGYGLFPTGRSFDAQSGPSEPRTDPNEKSVHLTGRESS